MTVEVHLDLVAIDEMLNAPDGPVGLVIEELSHEAAHTATVYAPVMKRHNLSRWGKLFDPRYQYGPLGATKASVRPSGFRYNALGQIYSGVNVNYGPTLFLERPARQIYTTHYMFMSRALDSLEI